MLLHRPTFVAFLRSLILKCLNRRVNGIESNSPHLNIGRIDQLIQPLQKSHYRRFAEVKSVKAQELVAVALQGLFCRSTSDSVM